MDQRRFDAVAKTLAAGVSRRRIVGGLAAGLAGGTLALLGMGPAAAKTHPPACRLNGNACDSGSQCCSGDCCGGVCCSLACCGGQTCTELATDAANCGVCGHQCTAGQQCAAGRCCNTTCVADADCCRGSVCLNGVCCLPSGATCDGTSAPDCCSHMCDFFSEDVVGACL